MQKHSVHLSLETARDGFFFASVTLKTTQYKFNFFLLDYRRQENNIYLGSKKFFFITQSKFSWWLSNKPIFLLNKSWETHLFFISMLPNISIILHFYVTISTLPVFLISSNKHNKELTQNTWIQVVYLKNLEISVQCILKMRRRSQQKQSKDGTKSKEQKQPSKGVLRKRYSEIMQQTYRTNCDFNKVAL